MFLPKPVVSPANTFPSSMIDGSQCGFFCDVKCALSLLKEI